MDTPLWEANLSVYDIEILEGQCERRKNVIKAKVNLHLHVVVLHKPLSFIIRLLCPAFCTRKVEKYI